MELIVKDELRSMIPPLSEEEKLMLHESIMAEGCRDALIVWPTEEGMVLIDGHNRYEICEEYNRYFKTTEIEFNDIDEAKIWMIENQMSRRNISDFVKFELLQKKKEILNRQGREKQAHGETAPGRTLLSITDKSDIHNTRNEIAKDLNKSTGWVAMADVVYKKAPEEVKEKLRKNEITVSDVYGKMKNEEKKAKRIDEIRTQLEQIEKGELPELKGLFEVVVLDPPWAYGREYDPETSRVANPYPEMSQDQIKKIEIPFADNCILFLWTTHAFIWDAKELINEWGFDYKATIGWDKEKIGMGAWLRMQCEFCLVAIKGKPYWNNTTWRDIIREPRREHSRKPEIFYQMVEEITIGRRLDYFSRSTRNGWEVFGNDTEKF